MLENISEMCPISFKNPGFAPTEPNPFFLLPISHPWWNRPNPLSPSNGTREKRYPLSLIHSQPLWGQYQLSSFTQPPYVNYPPPSSMCKTKKIVWKLLWINTVLCYLVTPTPTSKDPTHLIPPATHHMGPILALFLHLRLTPTPLSQIKVKDIMNRSGVYLWRQQTVKYSIFSIIKFLFFRPNNDQRDCSEDQFQVLGWSRVQAQRLKSFYILRD